MGVERSEWVLRASGQTWDCFELGSQVRMFSAVLGEVEETMVISPRTRNVLFYSADGAPAPPPERTAFELRAIQYASSWLEDALGGDEFQLGTQDNPEPRVEEVAEGAWVEVRVFVDGEDDALADDDEEEEDEAAD